MASAATAAEVEKVACEQKHACIVWQDSVTSAATAAAAAIAAAAEAACKQI